MKYIKTYKIFENLDSDLISKLEEFDIKNYTINSDDTISVNGDVYLNNKYLKKIPFNFHRVTNCFDCKSNKLTSLKGCPLEVGKDFVCSYNYLTSLKYCPSEIGEDFNCSYNQLTMLDCSSYIKGHIFCNGNEFTKEPEFFGDCEGEIIWK